MNSNILFYQSAPEVSNISALEKLPENIDVFSNLKSINGEVNKKTLESYNRLIEIIKKNLSTIDNEMPINNNLSKIINFVDEDKEIELEWIVRNNYRIGFIIDTNGNISYWRTIKNGNSFNSFSDEITIDELEDRICILLDEILKLT